MIELTVEQHEAIGNNSSEPARAVDPVTKAEYVLVPADVFDRIKRILGADTGWEEYAYLAALPVFARDGWEDPRMDVYDKQWEPEK